MRPGLDQTAVGPARECRHAALDASGVAQVERAHHNPQRCAAADRTANCERALEMAASRSTAARFSPGAICLSSSSHFPLMPNSKMVKSGGVASRPRQACDEAGADGIADIHEHDRHGASPAAAASAASVHCYDGVRCQRDQLGRAPAQKFVVAPASGARSRWCGPRSIPAPADPDERLPCEPAIPDRPRIARRAPRCAACARAAAHAQRAARRLPRRRAA